MLSERFDQALSFASRLHSKQVRKSSDIPYIAHLLAVTALVIEDGGGEDEAIAALLHDAVEDQGGGTTREEIRRRFGDRVVAIVDGCSDAETMPKPPWRERKERFIASLYDASAEVIRVTAADKLHNARALCMEYDTNGDAIWDRFKGGRNGTLWYYSESTKVLSDRSDSQLVRELVRVVDELYQIIQSA
ncbi:MAG: HD domain-containing protein [Chloroflexota bacterium]|nr:HD domain-containing protein [Chloroflexota bacterium]